MDSERIESEEPVASISADQLYERLARGDGAFLLDVRPAGAARTLRVEGPGVERRHVPVTDLREDLAAGRTERLPEDRTVTVVCSDGDAGPELARALSEEGYDANYLERGMRGWASVYEYAELDAAVDATVAQYRRPSTGCLSYLVVSDGEAAVVDPLHAFAHEYVRDARALGADLTYALDTRVHDHHVSGVRTLADRGEATAVISAAATTRGVQYGDPFETLADGGTLGVGSVELRAIPGPDHTAGPACYRVGDVVFTGDAVAIEAPQRENVGAHEGAQAAGRSEDAPSTAERFVTALLSMPDDTILAPAHVRSYSTQNDNGAHAVTLGGARESVRPLLPDSEASAGPAVTEHSPRPAVAQEIRAVNLGERTVSDERVNELEREACAAKDEGRDEL